MLQSIAYRAAISRILALIGKLRTFAVLAAVGSGQKKKNHQPGMRDPRAVVEGELVPAT